MPPQASPADRADAVRTAEEIMTPNPRTCSPFSSVLEAVMIFRDADCGVVPITEEGRPIGILTDRDVALALADYPDLGSRPVSDIMTKNLVTVLPNETLEALKGRFGDAGVRRLLVVDAEGQLQGIIAWADLAPRLSERGVGQVVSEVVEQP